MFIFIIFSQKKQLYTKNGLATLNLLIKEIYIEDIEKI